VVTGVAEQEFASVEDAIADVEAELEVVLEGTVVLELDDGAEVTLHRGDTVVQHGTRHR
jgi:uncharacterized cupin superfamily protein